jgi:hypothetical protein
VAGRLRGDAGGGGRPAEAEIGEGGAARWPRERRRPKAGVAGGFDRRWLRGLTGFGGGSGGTTSLLSGEVVVLFPLLSFASYFFCQSDMFG